MLAVVGELNTIVRNGTHWPILYGAGNYDTQQFLSPSKEKL